MNSCLLYCFVLRGGSLGSILKGEEVEKKEGSSFKQRLVSSP